MDVYGKRVYTRNDNRGTSPNEHTPSTADIVGWFANKYNMSHGWVVAELDHYDKLWFERVGESTEHVYRVYGQHGTTLVKFRVKTGTVSFFDNRAYESTDLIAWERFFPYHRLFID